jgi:hypothetical protein
MMVCVRSRRDAEMAVDERSRAGIAGDVARI